MERPVLSNAIGTTNSVFFPLISPMLVVFVSFYHPSPSWEVVLQPIGNGKTISHPKNHQRCSGEVSQTPLNPQMQGCVCAHPLQIRIPPLKSLTTEPGVDAGRGFGAAFGSLGEK